MASNGQRQTLEQNETNEGLSVPDTWERLPRDEDPVTAREGLRLNADALRKALDGVRLTPTPGESRRRGSSRLVNYNFYYSEPPLRFVGRGPHR